eukprot:12510928-Alexandrium_andersonii.AAC.1
MPVWSQRWQISVVTMSDQSWADGVCAQVLRGVCRAVACISRGSRPPQVVQREAGGVGEGHSATAIAGARTPLGRAPAR